MPDLDYAKVTGRFGLTVGDTLSDVDDDPDTVWCDSGRVLITPLNTFLKVSGAASGPFTAGGAVIEAEIGPDGRLLYQGKNYLYVVDLTSAKVNPQIAAGKATHKVTFSEVMAGTTRVDFPEFTCRLTAAGDGVSAGGVNDLTVVAPVQPGAASPIYRGEQGTGIAAASIVGGTNLQLQLTDGSTVDAGALPVGPGGSDPGVAGYIATPGSAVDVALKASIDQRVPVATASAQGKVELATTAEALAGTDSTRALTPAAAAAAFAGFWDPTKIVCVGDSWTEGNQDSTGVRYPQLVGTALPWATVTNLGKSGYTSTEIAIKYGAPVTLGAFTLPADTSQAAVTVTNPTTAYRTASNTSLTWLGDLRDPSTGTALATGVTLKHDASVTGGNTDPLAGWTVARGSAGSATGIPAGTVFVCTELDAYKNGTVVIGVGRNNFTDPGVVVRDVNSILTARRAPGAPFLVMPVGTAITETAGTVPYSRIKRVNAALRAAFPNEYVDSRRYLIDRGLVITATTPTSADLDQYIGDTIPASLMIAAGDHPNQKGYKATAAAVLAGLARVGAMRGPSSGVSGVTITALGPVIWSANDVTDPLGSPVNNILDRTGYTVLQAAATTTAPVLTFDATTGRRYLKFDGVDDRIYGITGDFSQPFTIIAKVRLRDLLTNAKGILETYGSPGMTLSVSTSGKPVLNATNNVQPATGTITANAVVTIIAIVNGASSAVGVAGTALTTGDAGTRGIITQFQLGIHSDGTYAAIDWFDGQVLPWALTEAQANAIAAQIG